MAITKILPVRGQLKGCLDYAANPQKTEYFSTADMQRLIGYTQNKDKTEHQLYVSGFNCMPQNAYCIMQATKQRWGKPLNGGNVGYHIIQSFKPGEATPDQVHEIGCEFARRFLADRFECTVSTHLDKGHLHNHIVVNSVSFMDGRMFRNDFTTYYKGIRAISDELCRENRLSVVETDGHGKSYGEWKHEKEGTPTLRGMVKADLEMAMASADSFAGFIAELQQMGYKVKYGPKVTHMAVRHKDAQRNIRLDKISPRFSEDALRSYFQELRKLPPAMQQEYKQQTVPHPPRWQPKELPMPVRRRARCRSKLSHNCRKITGFMACYYRYCSLLRKAYKGKVGKRCYYLLRDDFLKYNRYRRQCDLLWERQITTLDELLAYKENLRTEYDSLTAQRRALYRRKSKKLPLPIIRSKYKRSQPASESCGGRLSLVPTLRWTAGWCRIRCKGRHHYGMTSAKKIYITTVSELKNHAATAFAFTRSIALRIPAHTDKSVNTSTMLPWSVNGASCKTDKSFIIPL